MEMRCWAAFVISALGDIWLSMLGNNGNSVMVAFVISILGYNWQNKRFDIMRQTEFRLRRQLQFGVILSSLQQFVEELSTLKPSGTIKS